jgi:hypothetical protein
VEKYVKDSFTLFSLKDSDDTVDKLKLDKDKNRLFETDTTQESIANEFKLVDKETGVPLLLTREEKERIFLDSIQSYYYSGKQTLSDDEFNKLRDDLTWEGSVLVTLNRNETLFVNAVQAYNKGTPIMSDQQFDLLKAYLKSSGSLIAVGSEPKCYVDTGLCKARSYTFKPRIDLLTY